MAPVPIRTARLVLRRPVLADADDIARYCSDFDIARMTTRIPSPYSRQDALDWLGGLTTSLREDAFAITHDDRYAGTCSLTFSAAPGSAVVGYWLGKPFWGRGYATEAARALIKHGIDQIGLSHLTISHMIDNPASKNVIVKCGGVPTGAKMAFSRARNAEVQLVTYALTRSQVQAQPWYAAA